MLRRHNLRFDFTFSRDDGEIKPSAALMEKALKALGLPAEEVVTIGDGRYDIEAARRVGVPFIYLTHGHPAFEHTPSAETLHDVLLQLSELIEPSDPKS